MLLCKDRLESINRARCAVNLLVPALQHSLARGYRVTKTGKLFAKEAERIYSVIFDVFHDSRVDVMISSDGALYLTAKAGYLKSSHSIKYIEIYVPVCEPDGRAIAFTPFPILSDEDYQAYMSNRENIRYSIARLEEDYRAIGLLIHDDT